MSWVRVPLVTLKKEAVSNETKRYSLYFGMTGMSMVPAEITPFGGLSLFTNFMSQFRIGVYTIFVVKLVSIYESSIYKTVFLMAVIRK